MSFALVALCPNDKNFFGQCCEELSAGPFAEFLSLSSDNNTLDYTNLPASTYLDASTSESTSLGTSLSSDDDIQPHPFNHNELDASPYLHLAQNQFYNNLMGRAAVSDSELLSLDNISFESPQMPQHTRRTQRSLPPSPIPIMTASSRKARIADVLSQSFKKAASSLETALLRSPIRQPACSPNMMNAPHQTHNSEAWGQKLQQDASKFDFSFNKNSRNLTPPLACRVSDISPNLIRTPSRPSNAFVNPAAMHRSGSSISYSTPLSTPNLDHSQSSNSSGQLPSSGSLYPVTSPSHNASGSWGLLPGSPPVKNFRSPTMYTEMEELLWWNHASTAKMAQPAPIRFQNAQRATTLAMQLQNGSAYSTNDMSFDSASMASGLMVQTLPTHPHSMSMESPPMQEQQRGYFEPGRPRPQRRASHQQYAPGLRRQDQQQQQQHQRHRSSREKRQVSSDSDSSFPKSPSSSSLHVRKRRSSNTNRHSTPRTPAPGEAVDFVNFTPQDSKKILTGVAPSGSAKTKARRETDAMEKRRKLSQAAVRAVRAAGGDIESLVEEGFFV